MGTITTGIGLISGIDTASLIEQLLAIEARGKITLQQRVANLKAQQTAMLDVNARLLNLSNAVNSLRKDDIFDSAVATSSNESVLTVSASPGAVTGSYSFIIDRLVQTSQQMSQGFVANDTALGLNRMTFELGNGKLDPETELAELNGGAGVRRGKIRITDATGASAVVDLSTTGEVNEVIDAINTANGITVTATIDDDRLVLTDNSGGGGSMTIADVSGYFTATDLGIAGDDGGTGTLTGININTLGSNTGLSRLNDGNGVLRNSGLDNPDFTITDRDGTVHNIVLGQRTNGSQTDPAVGTIQEVIDRIATITAGAVTAAIAADGVSLELTDTTGGGGSFSVAGTGVHGDRTANDLGILNTGVAANTISGSRVLAGMESVLLQSLSGGAGILGFGSGAAGQLSASTRLGTLLQNAGITTNGTSLADLQLQDRAGVTYQIDLDELTTVQDLIDKFDSVTGGGITLEVITGDALRATNSSTGGSNFQIQDINGSTAVADLGLTIDSASGGAETIDGNDLDPAGPGGTTLDITNRNGVLTSIDLSTAVNFADVVDLVNAAGAGVTASLNDARNGLLITDSTGGATSLIIAGNAADDLGISTGAVGVNADTLRGSNLQLQYVSGASSLDSLNYGRGVSTGKFRVVDADGDTAEVDIGTDAKTLQDVIDEINSKGLDILARVNDNGDGITIENTSVSGTLAVRVDNVSGSTAADLGILGAAADPTILNAIDGSYERTVVFDPTDTLSDIISTINGSGVPVTASIINTGSGGTPYRLTFASDVTGRGGDLSVDAGSLDLGLTELAGGRDARVFFGSTDPASGVLIKSDSNTLDDVIQDVNIDLLASSSSVVTVNVTSDTGAIIDAVKNFVTTFNDATGRIKDYDSFNSETETRGVLLGDPTLGRVRGSLYRQLTKSAIGVDSQYRFLTQVGIRTGAEGVLEFNQDRFRTALEDDPDAVAALFVAFAKTVEEEDLGGGVTTGKSIETFTALGVGEQFVQLMESLTNSIDGTLKNADDNFESQIGLIEDRITQFDQRLEAKRQILQRQFGAMEAALARLQGQQNSLLSLQSAVLTSQTLGARSAQR